MGFSRIQKTFPTWVRTLDLSLEADHPVEIKGFCSTCGKHKRVDLVALRKLKGGSYSLINRRTRCHLTASCPGWIKFQFKLGVFRPLFDDDTGDRWSFSEMDERWARRDAEMARRCTELKHR